MHTRAQADETNATRVADDAGLLIEAKSVCQLCLRHANDLSDLPQGNALRA